MKAIVYDEFKGPLRVDFLPDPAPPEDGVVIEVGAAGICRSDWHGWQGHDADIKKLPHVPGHEFAGTVCAIGRDVTQWQTGDRVTVPFVVGCGRCRECASGNQQVCDDQFQPGFTDWGSFAQFVAVRYADGNLVRLPEDCTFTTAASFGCRLSTAYRAVMQQGQLQAGQWVAIHGCGGLGLSAVMIAAAASAKLIAVDIQPAALKLASEFGATETIDATSSDPVASIHELTDGGADLSLDTLGSHTTATNSIRCLRKRGRHVQVGLLAGKGGPPPLPRDLISRELSIVGSHGLAAHHFPQLFKLVSCGKLAPQKLVQRHVALEEAAYLLPQMSQNTAPGITVIDKW